MSNDVDLLKIRDTRYDNLSLSRDDLGEEDGPLAVFLYIPDTTRHDHEHIALDLDEAAKVHEWLGRFLKDNGR